MPPPKDSRSASSNYRKPPPEHQFTVGTLFSTLLGSGSTLMAAETTGRVCCGIELDPLYIDVIIRRYEAATHKTAILADADRRRTEQA